MPRNTALAALAVLAVLSSTLADTLPPPNTLPSHQAKRPPPPTVNGNPFVALASAFIGIVLYLLQAAQNVVTFVTITIPTFIVRMLHSSFTISLGFAHLAALFALVAGTIFFLVRYRYLTRYTRLKETALPPPSPPSFTNALPSDSVLNDHSRRSSNPLHSYLDDFLSAIRIFGYLEKPVFHELSRHLQTRRLAAGDSIEVGGGEFWCVVEGRVQVFAPSSDPEASSPRTPDPFKSSSSSFNGYSLINEVSTGGTLSSLFSILSLFTEDIKLSWTPSPDETDTNDELRPFMGRTSRANSDVSQLSSRDLGFSISPIEMAQENGVPDMKVSDAETDQPVRGRSTSVGTADGTARQSSWSPSPTREQASISQPVTTAHSPTLDSQDPKATILASRRFSREHRRGTPDSSRPRVRTTTAQDAMKGTIARATVDSTLAMIPAEAFRKLTRKYPKATGSIVQVVLERFSRVTFMTAHKFLGLTREILTSEAALNSLVSNPLPHEFYTGGGMQALRDKFLGRRSRDNYPSETRRDQNDYFSYASPSPTIRAPSIASKVNTPSTTNIPLRFEDAPSQRITSDSDDTGNEDAVSTSPTNRHPATLIRRASAMRKHVAAGDLALTPAVPSGDTYYRAPVTPGLPRIPTWRGRMSSTAESSLFSRIDSDDEDEDEFPLHDALVNCIAKSIGLLQAPEATGGSSRLSVAASTNHSNPNSPSLFPYGRPGRQTMGNVLDLMNATTPQHNVGGLLRESLMQARMAAEDDQSSISASMHDSHTGMGQDVNSKILRDLGKHVDVLHIKKDSVLVKEGDPASGLYYVIDGFLDVSIPVRRVDDEGKFSSVPPMSSSARPFGAGMGHEEPTSPSRLPPQENTDEHLFTVKAGGLAGYLASLCANESYVNITAKTDCFVGFIPQHALDQIVERRPIVLLTLAKRLLSLLSPQVLHIDAGLDWIQLDAGKVLFEKGDPSKDFYVVINGRLRAVQKKPGSESVDVLREYGQGESVGELDVITATPHTETVQAIRETELVRMPAALFDAISIRHPATTLQFMRVIANKVRGAVRDRAAVHSHSNTENDLRPDRNLKTVCIMANTTSLGNNKDVVVKFASKLKASLEYLGSSTAYLDQATVMHKLGRHAFTRMGALKIAGWLADQEQHFKIVLYVVDTAPGSHWTQTCIRQADLVLMLGMGDDPSIGDYEKHLLALNSFARKELILLHDERSVAPGYTRSWLKNRPWVQAHYHVEMPGVITTVNRKLHDPAAVTAFKHLREQLDTKIKQYRGLRPLGRRRPAPHNDDFARIARRLCGKQVGLVLGGGGARGISHIGMLQALEEAGVPVDAIGGCSIGSMIGGLYSRNTDLLETTGRAKQFSGRMGSMLRILSDVTYPFVAYTTGHEFNRGIYKAFYNTQIEDMWIPFFCNSTNITHSRMEVHRSGYAWRYVRASMTLAGFLPPLSDNGNLLVDGGYMDNTPIGPLRASGIKDIIVVDVGSVDDTSARNYGDSVSGWWLFVNRFNPFFKGVVPSMTEISSRLTYVSSVKTLEDVKSDPNCLYMAMPVQQYETIGGFKQFSEVLDVGLKAARQQLKEWSAEGKLSLGLVAKKGEAIQRRGSRIRRSSI